MSPVLIIVALRGELHPEALPSSLPLIYCGVGKVNAALATQRAIAEFQPREIINFGTAGRVNAQLTGLQKIARVVQRDMNAEPLAPRGVTPLMDGPHHFESGEDGVICGTGDSFVTSRDEWLHDNKIDLVDMELFAIAAAAYRANVKWSAYKFISDDANEAAAEDWQAKVNHSEDLFLSALKDLGYFA
jgi:adenosylhomocysteine nucleosidase